MACAAVARDGYREKLGAHLAEVQNLCQRLGIAHVQLSTAQPLELALFDFLKARASRAKLIRRRAA